VEAGREDAGAGAAGTTIPGGINQHDTSGTGAGPNVPAVVLVDSAGAEVLGLLTASPAANSLGDRLKALLSGIVLAAGTAIIGKVGIDQTTPGTTNAVVATIAPSTTAVAQSPTVTASAYAAGNVMGGIVTFASILAATSFNGVLQSIALKFKGTLVTGNINVALFKASPSNGTYTDKSAPTWNAADMANLLGIYQLTTPLSKLGTMTVYNLDGIGKAIVGASQSLYAVVIVDGTPTPASTSDFTIELGVLPG
jgi:hypothetical protein